MVQSFSTEKFVNITSTTRNHILCEPIYIHILSFLGGNIFTAAKNQFVLD